MVSLLRTVPQSARWSEAARGEEVERIIAAGDAPVPAEALPPPAAAAATLMWYVPCDVAELPPLSGGRRHELACE